MEKKLNVAAYCRVSTDRDDQANSLANQRLYFGEYIRNHDGWELYNVYYDEGISGTQTMRRNGFLRMIHDAMDGRIDLILTKEVSRFARNTVDTLSYTRKLKEAGIGVVFTIDNIDTRESDGELRLTIMASMAQEESRKTSERVRWGQKRRMEQGIVFGRDLLGYIVKDGKMFINEEEAPVVQAIFHKYTNEGKGTCVIARELLEEGMNPKRVSQWSNTMILKVLRNEKYVGDLCQKKTITSDYLTHTKKYNCGEEEMIYLKNHHEPIIDRNLWKRTQQELEWRSQSKEQKARHNNRYWYSGRIYCGQCGRRFVSRTKKRKDGTVYKGFRCEKSAKEGSLKKNERGKMIGCNTIHISERTLLSCLQFVMQHIQINHASLKKEILEEIRGSQIDCKEKNDIVKLEKKIQELQEKKSKAVDFMINGIITQAELFQQRKWYDEKIQTLHSSLDKVKKNAEIQNRQQDSMEQYIQELDKIIEYNYDDDIIFKEILEKIIIYRNHSLDVYLKGVPFPIRVYYKAHGKGNHYMTEIIKMEVEGETEENIIEEI